MTIERLRHARRRIGALGVETVLQYAVYDSDGKLVWHDVPTVVLPAQEDESATRAG